MWVEHDVQLVACRVVLATDVPAVAAAFLDRRPSAVQDHPIEVVHRIEARRTPEGFRVADDTGVSLAAGTLDEANDLVDRRMHELAVAALAGHTKLHAGCGTWHGRRFLVVGAGHAGKTTLMTRLLVAGCEVEGDEFVALRDGAAVAYPRRFGIRRLTLSLVPEVGALRPDLATGPGSQEPGGYHVLALDPAHLQKSWRIGVGAVDVVFLLGPRRQGRSACTPCPGPDAFRRLAEQSAAPENAGAPWVRHLSELLRGAHVYALDVGDLDSAATLVSECLHRKPAGAPRPGSGVEHR